MFLDNTDNVVIMSFVTMSLLGVFFVGLGLFIWKDSQRK